MKKPIKPIEPKYDDFPLPKESNGKNHLGEPLYTKLDYVSALKRHNKAMEKYYQELQTFEQLKMTKDIKRSSEKLILRKYKITKI